MMYAALLSGCMFAAALAPARLPNSRIMRQPGLSWTGLYDEHGRPVTMDELRAHKFVHKDFRDPFAEDATDSRTHPIWQEQRFYGVDGPEPLKDPWGHMMHNLLGSRYFQREGLPQYLFHYTSSDAGARIFETGQLLPSVKKETGDASEGDGVYLTSLPPWAPYDVVLDNNYDGANRRRYNQSRTEAYVRIAAWELSPDVEVERADVKSDRSGAMKGKTPDVYIVRGKEALDLSKSQDTLLKTEPEAWIKSNARRELIRVKADMERKQEETWAKMRESRKAFYDSMSEEDPWMDLSEEYASLAEEEREAQLRLQRPEDERCLDGCSSFRGQRGIFRWELKQEAPAPSRPVRKKQRPRRGKTK